MKIYQLYILLALAAIGFSSCSVIKQGTYSPDSVQLNLSMEDLQPLGEVEISVEYRTYLGFIRAIDTINGIAYDGQIINKTKLPNHLNISLDSPLDHAAYLIFEKYPDAEYLIVSHTQSNKTRLFLGNEIATSAKIKAYKIK